MKRIVIAGGSGFLGQALTTHFLRAQWEVVVLTRLPGQTGVAGRQIGWDGCTLAGWQKELEGASAVLNLAGKSVNCRYNACNRREILDSRVNSTRVLGQAIERCAGPPQVWLNASTATIYRHTLGEAWDEAGETEATEEAKDRFSVEVAWAWEQALNEAATPRTRKIAIRMAMVLGLGTNSVFPVLLRLVRFGLGGTIGSGHQFVSWVHYIDYCRAVLFSCLWFGPPSPALWRVVSLAGGIGFLTAIGVHPLVGYTEFSHLAAAYLGAILFSAGLALCHKPMCEDRAPGVESQAGTFKKINQIQCFRN